MDGGYSDDNPLSLCICGLQVYSQMRKGRDPKATEIDKLMEMYPRLRIASIDAVEHDKDPRIIARYDSVLYKWDQERRCPTEVSTIPASSKRRSMVVAQLNR